LNAEAFLRDKSARAEDALRTLVAEWHGAPPRLVEAVSYSLFAGGKRRLNHRSAQRHFGMILAFVGIVHMFCQG